MKQQLVLKFRLNQRIEAGVLPSYIGFETATAATNLTVSRSLLAENSPYYMTGIKLNHQFDEKWFWLLCYRMAGKQFPTH